MKTIKTACIVSFIALAFCVAANPGIAQDAAARKSELAPADAARDVKVAAPGPQIEVCFVLDTTGSMGGLIEGAKRKIWSIANQMVAAKPTPKLKIGLIGYRDRGDEYVTKVFDLTEDIDAVYARLQEFQAGGGGDGPESVNQALHESVTKMTWSADKNVLKIVFLVGDAPPHMDYQDDVKYKDACQAAVKKDLIINTVQCGALPDTTPIWKEIASLAEGSYVAIGQTGDMQIISTPMDAELSKLNVEVGKTIVAYGGERERRSVVAKQARAEAAAPAAAADRLSYNLSSGGGRGVVVQGGGDLVDDVRDGHAKLEEVKKEELPEEMRGMSAAQQEAYLKEKAEARTKLQAKINDLLKQRQAYIDAETKKLAQQGKGDAFDTNVAKMLREQAKRKNIEYKNE